MKELIQQLNKYADFIGMLLQLDKRFKVNLLPEKSTDLGYTYVENDKRKKTQIYMNPRHMLIHNSSNILLGVLIHEVLHSKYTHPEILKMTLSRNQIKFPDVLMDLSNILEDYTIESRALVDLDMDEDRKASIKKWLEIDVDGKEPLRYLNSAIYNIWAQQPAVTEQESEFDQVIGALIAYTDIGPLPVGSQMTEKARDAFLEIARMFTEVICEDSVKRTVTAYKAYQILEPLIPEDHKPNNRTGNGTQGDNSNTDEPSMSSEDKEKINQSPSHQARKKVLQNIEKEKSGYDPQQKNSSSNSGDNQKQDDSSSSDSPEKQGLEQGNSGSPEKKGQSGEQENVTRDNNNEQTSQKNEGNDSSNGSSSASHADGNHSEGNEADNSSGDDSEEEIQSNAALQVDPREDNIIGDYVESLREIENIIIKENASVDDIVDIIPETPLFKDSEELRSSDEVIDYRDRELEVRKYQGQQIKCTNIVVQNVNEQVLKSYDEVCKNYRPEIMALKKSLGKIIGSDEDCRIRTQSGRFEVDRYTKTGGTSTEIFSKMRDKNKRDSIVYICADNSGSMGGEKNQNEKIVLTIIAEAMSQIGLPFKVMTFNDTIHGVVHRHYVNYRNTKAARAALMTINPEGCNFDGYSIRYALKEMLNHRVANKLMIVISDGQPYPHSVHVSDAVLDTRDAVVEARRKVKVVGIALGVYDTAQENRLKYIYQKKDEEKSFVSVRNVKDLQSELSLLIKKEVKKW